MRNHRTCLVGLLLIAVALSGCAAEVLAGFSAVIGGIGVGQRVIDHGIQREKNERLKALEEQLKVQNERVFKLCEQVKRQGKPTEGECR